MTISGGIWPANGGTASIFALAGVWLINSDSMPAIQCRASLIEQFKCDYSLATYQSEFGFMLALKTYALKK